MRDTIEGTGETTQEAEAEMVGRRIGVRPRWRGDAVAAALLIVFAATSCGDGDDGPSALDIATSDVDGDEAAEGLDDVLDGAADPAEVADDLKEQGEALAEAFGEDGGGRVEINGESFSFVSSICFAGQGDFTIEGMGEDSAGTAVWVSISHTVDSREELEEFFDESMLESLYGDADPIVESRVSIEWGRDELYGSAPDGEHRFEASSGTVFSEGELDLNASGDGVSGSGSAKDFNFVSGDFEQTYDFTFEAACS